MPKIRYIKNEFRFGITEYKTPCPFGMRDRYALQVLRKSVKELQEYGVKAESILKKSARSAARKKKAAKPGGRKKKGGAG